MGFIRKLDANVDIQTFPGAKFELTGQVPQAQCSEARIEGDDAETGAVPRRLDSPGSFVGFNLIGKQVTITAGIPGVPLTWGIDSNTDNSLDLDAPVPPADPVTFYVHDGGSLILTRNIPSFAQFIHNAGYAYTIKAGKLYTNMPSGLLKNACTILFDPLT